MKMLSVERDTPNSAKNRVLILMIGGEGEIVWLV